MAGLLLPVRVELLVARRAANDVGPSVDFANGIPGELTGRRVRPRLEHPLHPPKVESEGAEEVTPRVLTKTVGNGNGEKD